jgi:hypothetical protein
LVTGATETGTPPAGELAVARGGCRLGARIVGDFGEVSARSVGEMPEILNAIKELQGLNRAHARRERLAIRIGVLKVAPSASFADHYQHNSSGIA